MNKILEIKDKLYDLINIACDSVDENGDTKISQNLGIAMTNAVKKGGVVNIISQNISFQKIVPKIVDVVKDLDLLDYGENNEIIQIEHLPDPVEDCCKYFYNQRTSWKDFRETMRIRYMDYVRRQSRSNQEAARFLNVHNSYVTKHLNIGKEEGVIDADG